MSDADPQWKTRAVEYEGYPLLLRCPFHLPYERQAELPILFVLTHILDHVTESGLPEARYNTDLLEFDSAAVQPLLDASEIATVLVETFGGKRTYYSYISRTADVDAAVARLQTRFPDVRLEHETCENADWRFIRRYAADYGM